MTARDDARAHPARVTRRASHARRSATERYCCYALAQEILNTAQHPQFWSARTSADLGGGGHRGPGGGDRLQQRRANAAIPADGSGCRDPGGWGWHVGRRDGPGSGIAGGGHRRGCRLTGCSDSAGRGKRRRGDGGRRRWNGRFRDPAAGEPESQPEPGRTLTLHAGDGANSRGPWIDGVGRHSRESPARRPNPPLATDPCLLPSVAPKGLDEAGGAGGVAAGLPAPGLHEPLDRPPVGADQPEGRRIGPDGHIWRRDAVVWHDAEAAGPSLERRRQRWLGLDLDAIGRRPAMDRCRR